MKASRRLVIAFVLVGILPVLFMSGVLLSRAHELTEESTLRYLDALAYEKANRVTDMLFSEGVTRGEGYALTESDVSALRGALAPAEHDAIGTLEVTLAARDESGVSFISNGALDGVRVASGDTARAHVFELPLRPLYGERGLLPDVEDYRAASVMAAYRPLPVTGLGITVEVSREDAFAPLHELTLVVLLCLFVALIAIIVVAVVLSESTVRPFAVLSRAITRAVRRGEYGAIPESRVDEAGRLASVVRTDVVPLAEQHALDRAVFEGIGEGVVVADAEGRVIRANVRARELLGIGGKGLQGAFFMNAVIAEDMGGERIPEESRPFAKALRGTQNVTGNLSYVTARHSVPVSVTCAPIMIDGARVGVVAAFRDRSQALALDRAKSEFVTLASHQLRTPLSSIRWYAEVLLRLEGKGKKYGATRKEYVKAIESGAARMARLIHQLLTMSRMEGGIIRSAREKVDLRTMTEGIIDAYEMDVRQQHLDLAFESPKRVPPVFADPRFVEVIVEALVSNAVKYSREGGKVTVKLTNGKDSVTLRVEDEGYGIPEAQQSRVFEKLFRADNVALVDTDGTGLGLYIARGLMDLIGGELSFASEEGRGSTFIAVFPKPSSASGKKKR